MAATIVISCPQCKKQMKVPAELQGKKVRCKECGTTFPVKAAVKSEAAKANPGKPAAAKSANAKPAAAPAKKPYQEPQDDGPVTYSFQGDDYVPPPEKKEEKPALKKKGGPDELDSNPYGVTEMDLTPRCPHCAKELDSEDAVICLHCGYNTQTRQSARTKRVLDQTFVDYLLWLGPGILCIFGIAALLGADYWFVWGLADTWKELDETSGTQSFSGGLKFWFVCMSVWGIWKQIRFAFNRLVMNPKPPEIEIK